MSHSGVCINYGSFLHIKQSELIFFFTNIKMVLTVNVKARLQLPVRFVNPQNNKAKKKYEKRYLRCSKKYLKKVTKKSKNYIKKYQNKNKYYFKEKERI